MNSFKRGAVFGVLALVAGGVPLAGAQDRAPAMRGEAARGPEAHALAAVVQFLQLRSDQVPVLVQLLQARQQAVAPVLQQIALREQQIAALVAAGGDPAAIGALMIQVHQLRQVVTAAQASFLANVEALLDEAQRQRLAQVRVAARLQPILPAFFALQLL
jgi:hypothetical protein